MWWNHQIFGFDGYEVTMWFLAYGIMGWFVESIYMSICNKKLTNRGFARGPFCPIYGVGALTVFFLLKDYSDNNILLFFLGAFLATALEFLTALLMDKVFGEIWWDYNEKPFNYKGIVCLESTIAWGFYTVFLFMFLQNIVAGVVSMIPRNIGQVVGSVILFIFFMDFTTTLYREKKEDMPEMVTKQIDQVKEKISENFLP